MAKQESSRLNLEDIAGLLPKPITAKVELPSKGHFYDPALLNDGCIEVVPMSAREEKLIAGMRENNIDELIDILLSRCLKTTIPADELLITDRFYLLLMLRANSYGEEYNFKLTCPYCKQDGKYQVKLPGELEIKPAGDNDFEPFQVTLPVSKLKISFRLLRGKDSKDVRKYTSDILSKGQAGEGDPSYIYKIAKQITLVNGKTLDFLTAMELVSNLPAKDSTTLKTAYDRKTPGILTAISKDCVSCGKKINADLPMTAEFFYPELGGEEDLNA